MSPEERNRDLGKRIELARRAVNLTQGELAEKMSAETGISISKATISRIEAGTGRPIYEVEMDALVAILGQSRNWFKGDPEAMFRVNPRYREWGVGRLAYPLPQAAA